MARARYAQLTPQQRGAITRRARAEGKDPARVHAALKGQDTRAARELAERRAAAAYAKAVRHGQQARERTERALEPAQKARRTREAGRIQRAVEAAEPVREALPRGRAISSLEDLDRDYGDYDDVIDYDFEGHLDTTGKAKK